MRRRLAQSSVGIVVALSVVGRAWGATLLSVYPIFQLTEAYNDNIELSASHHLGDFVTTGVLGFDLEFGNGERIGSLQYDTVFQSFVSHPQFNSYAGTNFVTLADREILSHDLAMTVNDSVAVGSITSGLLIGNTGAVSSQVAQAAVANGQTESNNFDLSLERRYGERWTANLSVAQDFYATSFQSSYTQGGALTLLYAFRPDIEAGWGYTFSDFRFSSLAPSEAHYIAAQTHWLATRRLHLDLAPGLVVIQNFGGSSSLLVRPAGTGSLGLDGERWNVTLRGGQLASSTGGLGGAGLNRFVTGVISYALQRHTYFNIGGNYSDYVGGGANGSFVSFGAGLSTQPRRWLSLFLRYQIYANSVNSAATAPAHAFTVAPGQTATANSYIVGFKIAPDVYDFGL